MCEINRLKNLSMTTARPGTPVERLKRAELKYIPLKIHHLFDQLHKEVTDSRQDYELIILPRLDTHALARFSQERNGKGAVGVRQQPQLQAGAGEEGGPTQPQIGIGQDGGGPQEQVSVAEGGNVTGPQVSAGVHVSGIGV